MATYAPEMTIDEARRLFFRLNDFGADGGYGARWVKMKLGPVPFAFPNIEQRAKAARLHDLHHILTEYPTTWRGEAEIGAWEVSTGLRRIWVGWLLDLLGFAIGLVINPRGVYRAFMRGRHSSNLFAAEFSEELLTRQVGVLRRQLGLDRDVPPASTKDKAGFLFWALVSIVTYLAVAGACLLPAAVLLLAWFWW